MIKTEFYMKRPDGVVLVRTYSDIKMQIKSDENGALYEEAIDPEELKHTYTETDIPIVEEEEEHGRLRKRSDLHSH